jgi:hypothetical protein
VVCLDGNFQHRHNAKAGGDAPLTIPPIFLDPGRVNHVRDLINNLESRDDPVSCIIFIPDLAGEVLLIHILPQVDPCSESHKAANDKRCETTWKGCDDTGLMGCCCRHDQVIYLANIHRTGEQRCLPLALLEKLFEDVEPSRPVGVLYDIGCSLKKFLHLVILLCLTFFLLITFNCSLSESGHLSNHLFFLFYFFGFTA